MALDHWAELAARGEAQPEPLTMAQLPALARTAGLPRTLTHRGRRAPLLALAGVGVGIPWANPPSQPPRSVALAAA